MSGLPEEREWQSLWRSMLGPSGCASRDMGSEGQMRKWGAVRRLRHRRSMRCMSTCPGRAKNWLSDGTLYSTNRCSITAE